MKISRIKYNAIVMNHDNNRNGPAKKAIATAITYSQLLELIRKYPYLFNFSALNGRQQMELLTGDDGVVFKKLINVKNIPRCHRITMFIKNPDEYIEYMDFYKFNRPNFFEIAKRDPFLFKKYNIPVNNLCVETWRCLIDAGEFTYLDFLENIKSIKTSADLKYFFKKHPEAVKNVTPSHIENSSLSTLNWLYIPIFLEQQYLGFPSETCTYLDQECLSLVISGKKQNARFKNARKAMLAYEGN